MINSIIFIVLVLFICFALRSTIKRILGRESCCSGGSSVIRDHKALVSPVISKKTMKIEGMQCDSCAARVERFVNKIDGASCTVNLKSNEAEISMSRAIADDELLDAIEKAGYKVIEG